MPTNNTRRSGGRKSHRLQPWDSPPERSRPVEKYHRKTTSVFLLHFHLIWCVKYRRKVLYGDIRDRLLEVITERCDARGWQLVSAEVMPDHVHTLVSLTPSAPITDVVFHLKGYSSFILRKEFPKLKLMRSLWTRSYFVNTVGEANSNTIRRYIEKQRERD